MDAIRQLLTRLGELAAHPGAFGILIAYAVLWFIFDRESLDWHATTTLIVWFMTLLIQRAEHRDTQALQAKMDELLHAHARADNAMTKIDQEEPEDICAPSGRSSRRGLSGYAATWGEDYGRQK